MKTPQHSRTSTRSLRQIITDEVLNIAENKGKVQTGKKNDISPENSGTCAITEQNHPTELLLQRRHSRSISIILHCGQTLKIIIIITLDIQTEVAF